MWMQKAPSVHMHEYSHARVCTCKCGKGVIQKVIQKVHLAAKLRQQAVHIPIILLHERLSAWARILKSGWDRYTREPETDSQPGTTQDALVLWAVLPYVCQISKFSHTDARSEGEFPKNVCQFLSSSSHIWGPTGLHVGSTTFSIYIDITEVQLSPTSSLVLFADDIATIIQFKIWTNLKKSSQTQLAWRNGLMITCYS